MMIQLYKEGAPAAQIDLPKPVFDAAVTLDGWLAANGPGVSLFGLGHLADLQRQLAEVTRERDALQTALKLADALRNREREQCHHYTSVNGRDMAINFREA